MKAFREVLGGPEDPKRKAFGDALGELYKENDPQSEAYQKAAQKLADSLGKAPEDAAGKKKFADAQKYLTSKTGLKPAEGKKTPDAATATTKPTDPPK